MEARIAQAQEVDTAMQKNAQVKKQYKRNLKFSLYIKIAFQKNCNQILFYYTYCVISVFEGRYFRKLAFGASF